MQRPKDWVKRERWKPVKNFPRYRISNMGRVRMLKGKKGEIKQWRLIRPHIVTKRKLARVNLVNENGKDKQYMTKLVADHWLRPRHPERQVRYKDKTDLLDCSVYNLYEVGYKRYKTQKLLPEERDYIRKRLKEDSYRGLGRELAEMFEVTPMAISDIKQQNDPNPYR